MNALRRNKQGRDPNIENNEWLVNTLGNYIFFSFAIAFVILVYYFLCGHSNFLQTYTVDKYSVFSNVTNVEKLQEFNTAAFHEEIHKELDQVYEDRKIHYDENVKTLSSVINAMGICCLLGLCLLYFDKRDEIEFFGISIPFKSIFLVLPIVIFYLWLSFGYSLYSALDSRTVCYIAAVKSEYFKNRANQLGEAACKPCTLNVDSLPDSTRIRTASRFPYYKFHRDYSKIHTLEDGGIVDGMSNVFSGFYSEVVYSSFYYSMESNYRDGEHLVIPTHDGKQFTAVAISLFSVFGTLLGLILGLMIALLLRFQKVYSNNSTMAVLLTVVVFVLLCLSFLGFMVQKNCLMPFCGYIWIVIGFVLWLYTRKLEGYAISPDTADING